MTDSPAQPIGVFDSGVGGLTVLEECLVTLPAEDFVYFGDTDWFPYGEKTPDQLRRRALAIARWLVEQDAKLIVVACNTATAAALEHLQTHMDVPVMGVMGPEARAAAQTTRNRRVGLLATEATVASGSYERMIHMNDAGVSVTSVACPRLAPAIQEGAAWDGELLDMLRGYTDPLRDANVDTVILGCTHYPMVEKPLRRMLQGVEIITAGEELAHDVRDTLIRRGQLRPPGREGSYRFVCSGDPERFREVGSRFLQMPLGDVAQVDPSGIAPAST